MKPFFSARRVLPFGSNLHSPKNTIGAELCLKLSPVLQMNTPIMFMKFPPAINITEPKKRLAFQAFLSNLPEKQNANVALTCKSLSKCLKAKLFWTLRLHLNSAQPNIPFQRHRRERWLRGNFYFADPMDACIL